jgi:hypothetical protein
MDDQDPRARELSQLKSDLAEFALRLDAFEARSKRLSLTIAIKTSPSLAFDVEFARQIVVAMRAGPPDGEEFAAAKSARK